MIPDFKILFDGNDRTEVLRPLLNSITVVDKPGVEADTADITVKMIDGLAVPDSGTDVSVSLGYRDSGVSEVFKGVANRVGLSGPADKLFIQATGVPLSDDKRMQGSHERAWNEPLTLGEVLRDIIQGAGFRARVHGDLDGIKLKRFIQSIETDIELLTQLAEAYGAIVKSDGETVAVVPRGSLERADGGTLEPVTIAYRKGSKWSWTRRQRNAYKSVVAFYQDEDSGETKAIIKGSGEPELRLKPIHQTKEAAEMAAQKELDKVKKISRLQLTVPGQFIAVGSPLQMTGFRSIVEQEYQVTRVTHTYGNGYTTQIEAEGE